MNDHTEPGDLPCPERLDPARLSVAVREPDYDRSLTKVNDHEVRMSVMTERFRWHRHPDSDELFIVAEGGLIIEFDGREVLLFRAVNTFRSLSRVTRDSRIHHSSPARSGRRSIQTHAEE